MPSDEVRLISPLSLDECGERINHATNGASATSGWPWISGKARGALYGRARGPDFTVQLAPHPGGQYNRLALNGRMQATSDGETLLAGRFILTGRQFWRLFYALAACALLFGVGVLLWSLVSSNEVRADNGESLVLPSLAIPSAVLLGGRAIDMVYSQLALRTKEELATRLGALVHARPADAGS